MLNKKTKEFFIEKYGENKIFEAGINALQEQKDLNTPEDIVEYVCTSIECKNCPVMINNYDARSEYEKKCLHTPCVNNLYLFIRDQVLVNEKIIQKEHDEFDQKMQDMSQETE